MITQDTDIKTVEKLVDNLGELPAAPVILHKALKLTSNLDSCIDDISKNIAADQILASKVIRLSNSPLYGRVRGISSLSEAIKVLGFNQVKSIIITASAQQMYQSGPHADIATILWHHSLATALASRLIVQKYGGLDKEEAYLCGLLHDIGKLVLLQMAPHVYNEIIDKVKETDTPFIIVEGKELGFNHVNVGRILLNKWNFPSHLVTQISTHHATKIHEAESTQSLGRVVSIADSIAKYIGASFYEPFEHGDSSEIFLGNSMIDDEDLIELRVETESHFNDEMNSFFE